MATFTPRTAGGTGRYRRLFQPDGKGRFTRLPYRGAAFATANWYDAPDYKLASGDPTVILDFVGNRYRANGADATLASLVTNATTLNASGMPATSNNILANGALLSLVQGSAFTLVIETSGGTNSAVTNYGLMNFAGNDAIIVSSQGSRYTMCGYDGVTGPTLLKNTVSSQTQQAWWPNVNKSGFAVDAAGGSTARRICLNGLWGTAADAAVLSTVTSAKIGMWAVGTPGSNFGGYIRRIIAWPRQLSAADLAYVTRPTPIKGKGSLFFGSGHTLTLNSAGNNALNWERTQPWSVGFAMRKEMINPGGISVYWSNVQAPTPTGYRGWELFSDSGSGNVPVVRIMSSYAGSGSGTNLIEVRGSTNLGDGNLHVPFATYDGSSQASGVKIYVDGDAETLTTVTNNLTGTIVNSPVQPFIVGSQQALDTTYFANAMMDDFTVWNRVLSPSEVAARSTVSTLPGVESGVVLYLPMDEGTGTAVADFSGNGYHGTIASAAQWVA